MRVPVGAVHGIAGLAIRQRLLRKPGGIFAELATMGGIDRYNPRTGLFGLQGHLIGVSSVIGKRES